MMYNTIIKRKQDARTESRGEGEHYEGNGKR